MRTGRTPVIAGKAHVERVEVPAVLLQPGRATPCARGLYATCSTWQDNEKWVYRHRTTGHQPVAVLERTSCTPPFSHGLVEGPEAAGSRASGAARSNRRPAGGSGVPLGSAAPIATVTYRESPWR